MIPAIVLAGGLGTRLRSVSGDLPKPMVPVAGRPFLAHVLDHLISFGIGEVVLAVSYAHSYIHNHFGHKYRSLSIRYSVEDTPLSTGGAILQAMQGLDAAWVVNGDTIFRVDLSAMWQFHAAHNSQLTIALKPMLDFDRYGSVVLNNRKRIVSFQEKKHVQEGLINGGIYLLENAILKHKIAGEKFSFEEEMKNLAVRNAKMYGYRDTRRLSQSR
jgi:D-glycero-alpha-D-manno-heptose 1-phosphate guanylyltransferase